RPAGRRGWRGRGRDGRQGAGGDVEGRGVAERAVGAGHGVGAGDVRAAGGRVHGVVARAVGRDRKGGGARDVPGGVAVGVEALGGVGLGPTRGDRGRRGRDRDRGQGPRAHVEGRGVAERAVGAGHGVGAGDVRAAGGRVHGVVARAVGRDREGGGERGVAHGGTAGTVASGGPW